MYRIYTITYDPSDNSVEKTRTTVLNLKAAQVYLWQFPRIPRTIGKWISEYFPKWALHISYLIEPI